jgi:predicted nucleic acid-binding protein
MIAADTSAWIDFLSDKKTSGASRLLDALKQGTLLVPPVVLVELLSFPRLDQQDAALIETLPRLEIASGYWERCAESRKTLLTQGLKCRLGDVLIAQNCIDLDIPLITEDQDFRHFGKLGLQLIS